MALYELNNNLCSGYLGDPVVGEKLFHMKCDGTKYFETGCKIISN